MKAYIKITGDLPTSLPTTLPHITSLAIIPEKELPATALPVHDVPDTLWDTISELVCTVSDPSKLEILNKLPALETLKVGLELNDISKIHKGNFTRLKNLVICASESLNLVTIPAPLSRLSITNLFQIIHLPPSNLRELYLGFRDGAVATLDANYKKLFQSLPLLQKLTISHCNLFRISDSIDTLTCLTDLTIVAEELVSVMSFRKLTSLTSLAIYARIPSNLLSDMSFMTNLQILSLPFFSMFFKILRSHYANV